MSDRYAWMDAALCAQADPDLWIHNTKGGDTQTPKRICGSCTVRPQCQAHAGAIHRFDGLAPSGVWGGLSRNQRENERRQAA